MSRFKKVLIVARTYKNWKEEIINSFYLW